MSKGPGKRQKLILEKIEELKAFHLPDILPINYTLKEYQSLHRAAVTLEKAGTVLIDRWDTGEMLHRSRQGTGNCGLKLLVHKVGTKIEHPMHFGICPTLEEVEARLNA